MTHARTVRSTESGFTLIEIVVVMGLLSSFMLMLVQLMGSGVDMFTTGQRGQDLADRGQLVKHATLDCFERMVGPRRTVMVEQDPDVRMLVSWENQGFLQDDGAHTRQQVVRATVGLTELEEIDLLTEVFRPIAEEETPGGEEEVARAVQQMIADAPRKGRADMLLFAWPQDPKGVFLELRHALFTNFDEIQIMDVRAFGTEEFPRVLVPEISEVLASNLLHVEFEFWSRETTGWGREAGRGGPEWVWDSARAGRLLDEGSRLPRRESFGLDLGAGSLRDLRDDTYPRWARITLVASRGPNEPPEAFLSSELASDGRTLDLTRADKLPKLEDSRFLKIGTEWVEYGDIRGRTLTGLKRAQRGTQVKTHGVGTAVRAGRQIVVYHRFPHGRDGS